MVEKVGIMPLRLAERVGGGRRGGRQGWTVCVCVCLCGGVQSIVHPLFRMRRSVAVGRRGG